MLRQEVVGLDLALARKRLGLTQKEIATQIGVDQATVSFWENGKSSPHVAILPRAAEAYGVTVDEILAAKLKAGDSA